MRRLPPGWEWSTVQSVGEVMLGRQRSPKYHHGPNMRPYLRVKNVFEDRIDLSDVKEMNFSPDEYIRYELKPGDILLNEGQSPELLGRPAMYRGELPGACFTNSLIRFTPRPGIEGRYALYLFRHYLHSGRFRQEARITTNIAHLSAQRFSAVEFPVPPLAEQQRILAVIEQQFSRLDVADASLQRARRTLPRLRATTLIKLLEDEEWETDLLEEVNDPERPIRYGILMPKEHVEDGVLYVKVKDYPKGTILLDQLRRTSPQIAERYRRATLRADDVLVSIRGTYGRVALTPPELKGGNITQDTARIAPLPILDPQFLVAYLRSEAAQRYFRRVARGVAVKGVNIGDLRKLPVPVPPRDEQERIVSELERQHSLIDALAAEIEAALRRSKALRRAILECAFTGRLVQQDPADEPASLLLERIHAERAAAPKPTRRGKRATA